VAGRKLAEFSSFEQFPRPLLIVLKGDKQLHCPVRKSSVDFPMRQTYRKALFGNL
jgi:hypothetical protein